MHKEFSMFCYLLVTEIFNAAECKVVVLYQLFATGIMLTTHAWRRARWLDWDTTQIASEYESQCDMLVSPVLRCRKIHYSQNREADNRSTHSTEKHTTALLTVLRSTQPQYSQQLHYSQNTEAEKLHYSQNTGAENRSTQSSEMQNTALTPSTEMRKTASGPIGRCPEDQQTWLSCTCGCTLRLHTPHSVHAKNIRNLQHTPKRIHAYMLTGPIRVKTTRLSHGRTGFNLRPGHSRIFADGNRVGRCHWSVGFLRDLPFPLPLQSGAALYLTRSTLIGSQDLDVMSHPNLSTPSVNCKYTSRVLEYNVHLYIWFRRTSGAVHKTSSKQQSEKNVCLSLPMCLSTVNISNMLLPGPCSSVSSDVGIADEGEARSPEKTRRLAAASGHDSHMQKYGSDPGGD
ncbi:hypothetical protein PR048_028413 [Dryococelus australis]|uniref:Uncharacterized protein n=1 Tax=Dryococelus australis TaxID=614101 RepID=A0ABQ9GAI1_9NEOP|nr:hypothetical protein PR048_028413 [Dryococelus australis]